VNFHHQITPSILPPLRARGTKIIYVVQDLKPVCGNYKMLTHDGVCERCKGGKFYQQTLHKCTKNSVFASAVNTVEMYVHHWLRYYDLIDAFITPSEFYRNKLIEFGLPAQKISALPNFIDVKSYTPQFRPGTYLLYLGRLSEEKGVPTLIAAMKAVPELRCKIAGTGPFEENVKRQLQEANCNNVEMLGHIHGERLQHELQNSLALVIPSEWYEAFGLCTVEAYACGKPVIGARIGGITETIVEGETGWLFEPGNVADLVRVLRKILESKSQLELMGHHARQRALDLYDAEKQYAPTISLYSKLLGNLQ
jgi:glycosyltransferase involved in cell wall biosynthesis